jgi:hypothetical protein
MRFAAQRIRAWRRACRAPDLLYERELRDHGGAELLSLGLRVESLSSEGVEQASIAFRALCLNGGGPRMLRAVALTSGQDIVRPVGPQRYGISWFSLSTGAAAMTIGLSCIPIMKVRPLTMRVLMGGLLLSIESIGFIRQFKARCACSLAWHLESLGEFRGQPLSAGDLASQLPYSYSLGWRPIR